MNKISFCLVLALYFGTGSVDAQFIRGGIGFGYGGGYGMRPNYGRNYQRRDSSYSSFKPTANISLGYGFPNLDKNQFAGSYYYYPGTATQTGPFVGSIDYQFNRAMSIGLLITHGTVNAPYYSYATSSQAFNGSLDNTAVMLDFVRYSPVTGKVVAPYIRTAIGINIWDENYTDLSGNKINYTSSPSDLAYQISLGANFYIVKNTGLFIEAGYGKYILNAGLAFKL